MLDFSDLTPVAEPVKIGKESFVLTEASGGAAIKYRNAQMRAAKLRKDKDGKETIDLDATVEDFGFADSEAILVAACLYRAGPNGELVLNNGIPNPALLVPVEKVRGWPVRVQTALYERIKEISDGLVDKKEDTEVKNESSATTDGSV